MLGVRSDGPDEHIRLNPGNAYFLRPNDTAYYIALTNEESLFNFKKGMNAQRRKANVASTIANIGIIACIDHSYWETLLIMYFNFDAAGDIFCAKIVFSQIIAHFHSSAVVYRLCGTISNAKLAVLKGRIERPYTVCSKCVVCCCCVLLKDSY